jgi:hypothetical protein
MDWPIKAEPFSFLLPKIHRGKEIKMNDKAKEQENTPKWGFSGWAHKIIANAEKNKGSESRWKGVGFGDYECCLCGYRTSKTHLEECTCCGATMDAFPNPHRIYKEES